MVLKERQDGVLVLTLNRPEKLNAITGELLDALYAALKEGEEDREVRALLLTGAGRAFSAGQDLTEFGDRKPDYEAHLRRYNRVVEALSGLEKPLVVAVNGVAAGAGMSLALWGDLRLAAVGASFTTAFVRIGLVPDSGLSFLLPRLVGLAKAQELLLLSPRLSAEEALALARRWGASLENMEGAAFARACLALGVRGAELRALSNPAGVRDKAHWRTKEALSALARAVRRLLAEEGGARRPPG